MHLNKTGSGQKALSVLAFVLLFLTLNTPQPVAAQLGQQGPQDVARAFLEAWNAREYQTMYLMLTTESQGRTTLPIFQTTYQNVADAIALDSLSYNIRSTDLQGTTAAVYYSLTLQSPSFGTIQDPERIMRLMQTPAGWRVAWSTMDIFDGLAANARVEVDSDPPARGNIYDRMGNLLVEENGTVIEIYAQLQEMSNQDQCFRILGSAVRRDYREIVADAANYNPDTRFFIGDMDVEEYNERSGILNQWCGINRDNGNVRERTDRRYVGHGAATHITGYLGQASEEAIAAGAMPGELVGQAGVELAYNDSLRGEAVRLLRITEPGGTIIRDLGGAEGSPAEDITLTIDRNLQIATAQALHDAFTAAEINWASVSPGGAVVILDVDDSAILALASYPTFDPGLFSPNTPFPSPGAYLSGRRNEPLFNRATQGQYAPGSVFKIVTTAATAQEGLMDPNETFYCGLQWENGPRFGDTLQVRLDWRASEADPEQVFPTGDVTISGALTSSCDPFYYEMGARLFREVSPAAISNYARRMGLGSRYGLNTFPEAAGVIPNPVAVEQAINEAIGQGDVQVTPLQMANLVAGVANGGTVHRPYIVQNIGRQDEAPSFSATPQVINDMELSQQTLDLVKQGMCDVTSRSAVNTTNGNPLGTAWFVFENSYYSICGKTGTAQTNSAPNAWFVAYVPAENPQIAIAAMVQNSREGSEVAAPIVRRILDDYLNVPEGNFAPWPTWWADEYSPLSIATGGTGGG
jgi:penicillin-binding protein 2